LKKKNEGKKKWRKRTWNWLWKPLQWWHSRGDDLFDGYVSLWWI